MCFLQLYECRRVRFKSVLPFKPVFKRERFLFELKIEIFYLWYLLKSDLRILAAKTRKKNNGI